MMRAALLLVASLCVVSAIVVPYKNCGTKSDLITINRIDASAWPVVRGKSEYLSLNVTINSAIAGGTYEVQISFDGLPLVDKKGNLKDKELNLTLPITAGNHIKNVSIEVPSFIPPGTAKAHILVKDDKAKLAVCVDVEIPFKVDQAFEEARAREMAAEIAATGGVNVPVPYKNCGTAADKFTITKVDASIWPPKVGAPFGIQVNGTLSQDLSGGKYEAKVKFLGIQIIDQKGTIADLAKSLNLTLPIRAGPYGFTTTQTIPAGIPKGDIEIHAQAFNQNNAELLCIDVTAKLQ